METATFILCINAKSGLLNFLSKFLNILKFSKTKTIGNGYGSAIFERI